MTARWPDAPDAQGRNYRHPAPRSIDPATISIVSVCAEHDGLRTAALQADPYYEARGYLLLNIPIVLSRWGVTYDSQTEEWRNFNGSIAEAPLDPTTLTEAQRLYINLFRYTGQAVKLDTCDCKVCECVDRAGQQALRRLRNHPKRRKCQHHLADDDDHTQALEQRDRKNRLVERAITFLQKNDAEFSWEYRVVNGQRVLYFTLLNITAAERNQAQAWADANVGAGRVVVVRG